jgi:hypothetical protein
MKNVFKLFVLALFLITAQAYGQTTLTSGRVPVPGDFFDTYQAVNTGYTPGSSGANVTWTYTGLIYEDTVRINYVSPSSTPSGSSFPNATVAETPGGSTYIYYRGTSTNFEIVGTYLNNTATPYSNPANVLNFPFSYNASINDNFAANYTALGFTALRTGTIVTTADAWGTINLPNGSHTNVLRVRITQNVRDSVLVPGFPVVTRVITDSYRWYNSVNKFPIFDISITSTQIGSGTPVIDTIISYAPTQTVGIQQAGSIVPERYSLSQNYPNPFNPATVISFDIPASGFVKLAVYDMLGREVSQLVNSNLNAGSYNVDFNAAGLNSGVYFYRLETNGFSDVKKMTVVK